MKKFYLCNILLCFFFSWAIICRSPVDAASQTAKNSFESGKGAGISYKLVLITEGGQSRVVSTSHVFKSGDRIKLLAKTNKEGYLTILNIGSSGSTHVLFNEFVEASREHEIPRKSNFRVVGKPGTEKILIMFSDNPNPFVPSGKTPEQKTALPSQTPSAQPAAASTAPSAQPAAAATPPSTPQTSSAPQTVQQSPAPASKPSGPAAPATDSLSAPLPGLLASLEGAKDIVLEDDLQTSYAVVSQQDNKIASTKPMVESSSGSHYGVVPASALKNGILTLEIKLNHK